MRARFLIRCAVASVVLLAVAGAANAATPAETDSAAAKEFTCKMEFSLDSWAVLYKRVSGKGTVTCDNGETMDVKLSAHGGGLTVGKAKVAKGSAKFTGVTTIRDVLGDYVGIDSTTAVDKVGGSGQAFTKGAVGMVLRGKSEGFALGTSIQGLSIKEAR